MDKFQKHSTALPVIHGLSTLAILFVYDQILLPMFHAGSTPFKFSYLFLVIWALLFAANYSVLTKNPIFRKAHEEIFLLFSLFLVIVVCAFIGTFYIFPDAAGGHSEFFRTLLLYFLIILAFGFGEYTYNFNFKCLLYLLYAYIFLTFVFVYLSGHFHFLADFYHQGVMTEAMSVRVRQTGLFYNPNVSMLMFNIPLLILVVAYKRGYVKFNQAFHFPLILFGALILSIVLESKNQCVVLSIVLLYNTHTLLKEKSVVGKEIKWFYLGVLVVIGVGLFFTFIDTAFVQHFLYRFQKIQFNTEANRAQSILRPLMTFSNFWARFKLSPIFGSGFEPLNMSINYIAGFQPKYFHNDAFFVLASSGLIGFIAYVYMIFKFCARQNWLFVIPFILPGLTNTLLQIVPVMLFYFFMMGCFSQKRRVMLSMKHER